MSIHVATATDYGTDYNGFNGLRKYPTTVTPLRGASLEEPILMCPHNLQGQREPRVDAELRVYLPQVGAEGFQSHPQELRDSAVVVAQDEALGDFDLL